MRLCVLTGWLADLAPFGGKVRLTCPIWQLTKVRVSDRPPDALAADAYAAFLASSRSLSLGPPACVFYAPLLYLYAPLLYLRSAAVPSAMQMGQMQA